MRKWIVLFIAMILLSGLVACGYEETKTYEITSARLWEEKYEHGVFAKKTDITEYIEVIYKTEDGYGKINEYINHIEISDENVVKEEIGEFSPSVYMTIELYEGLFD